MIVIELLFIVPLKKTAVRGLSQLSSCGDDDAAVRERKGLLLADHVLVNGVGRREAEDESAHGNHDDGQDHQRVPAEQEEHTQVRRTFVFYLIKIS